MKNLLIIFGTVAAIDYISDKDMDLTRGLINETGDAFWHVVDGTIDGGAYIIRRIGGEIAPSLR